MTTDPLTLARETLAKSEAATSAPWVIRGRDGDWSLNYKPSPGTVVHVATIHSDRADVDLIAHARTAAPELAAFVEDIHIALTDPCNTHGDSNCEHADCLLVVVLHIRRRLGLPSTESGT